MKKLKHARQKSANNYPTESTGETQPAPETWPKPANGKLVGQTAPSPVLNQVIKELKSWYSDSEKCRRLRVAIYERLEYLKRVSPDAGEVNEWNKAESHLRFHQEQTIPAEILKREQIVRVGLSPGELIRVRESHVSEVRKDAQQAPETELPPAELRVSVQSFLNKLNAQRRPPGTMDLPISGVAANVKPPEKRKRTRNTESRDHDLATAIRKTGDRSKYPEMTARQIAAYLDISLSAVYDHPLLVRVVIAGVRKRLWTTASVIAAKKQSAE